MLALALDRCRGLGLNRVLVTCDRLNVASARTILANGGVLENEVPQDGRVTQRYWIDLGTVSPGHFRALSAVFPVLLKAGGDGLRVLLHRRQNTGYMDGLWDFAAAAMWTAVKPPASAGRNWASPCGPEDEVWFSAEDTDRLLNGGALSSFSPDARRKFAYLGLEPWFGAIPRNLRALINGAAHQP